MNTKDTEPKKHKPKYTESFLIKLTKEQLIDIKKRQQGKNFSEWVRSVLLEQDLARGKYYIAVDKRLVFQLAKAGSNLNQIAKALNHINKSNNLSEIEYIKCSALLLEIKSQLDDILNNIKAGNYTSKQDDI